MINPATTECIGVLPHASRADRAPVSPQDRGKILKRAADLMHERAEHLSRIAASEKGMEGLEACLVTKFVSES